MCSQRDPVPAVEASLDELSQQVRELTAALEAARRAERELQRLLDAAPLAIYLKDGQGRYRLVNREYERLGQVTREQVRGKTDFDLFPAPVASLFREQDDEVRRRRSPVEFAETIPLPDGVHSFVTSKFPLFGPNGQVDAVGGVCTDITERVHAEEERSRLISHLSSALTEARTLRGILPICSHCRLVRDESGRWCQLEGYVEQRTQVCFSHGLCPDCAREHYPQPPGE